jgi:hypothetical protein
MWLAALSLWGFGDFFGNLLEASQDLETALEFEVPILP